MTIAVLIVNWNGGDFLRRCLESLHRQRRRPDHIVVVDNASTDTSLQLAEAALAGVELIRLDANVGFAHANNVAATAARGFDALALLNPDAFADPGWLEALAAAADRDPDCRIVCEPDAAGLIGVLDGAGDSARVGPGGARTGAAALEWPETDRKSRPVRCGVSARAAFGTPAASTSGSSATSRTSTSVSGFGFEVTGVSTFMPPSSSTSARASPDTAAISPSITASGTPSGHS
jgi:cellulose synthase/poly-beta-1,6-N-acetylglucosamine synthase-like glycosyltransferase